MPAKVTSKAAPAKVAAKKAVPAKVAPKVAAGAKKVTATRSRKVRTNVIFRRPHTLRTRSAPRYPHTIAKPLKALDAFRVIRHPATTETSLKMIEENDTIVFTVDLRANKKQIKQAVAKLYDIKAKRINTLIRPDGTKKAFVKLSPSQDALEVASKIGMLM